MSVVVDADVLIGALDGSDLHHAEARSLFTMWLEVDVTRIVSAVNLTEVLVAPAAEEQRLRQARAAIIGLGLTVHRPGEAIAVDAARLRRLHPISLPDAYCLATARHTGASVASFDQKIFRAARAEQIELVSRSG